MIPAKTFNSANKDSEKTNVVNQVMNPNIICFLISSRETYLNACDSGDTHMWRSISIIFFAVATKFIFIGIIGSPWREGGT